MLTDAFDSDVSSLEPLKASRSYSVFPYVPTQLPWGGLETVIAGGAPASPRKIPESTALAPAVRSTVIVTVPPAATLIGKESQAPLLKELESSAAWPFTEITSRRAVVSQSSAYRCRLPL